jgi:hypothetical protein
MQASETAAEGSNSRSCSCKHAMSRQTPGRDLITAPAGYSAVSDTRDRFI